MSCRAVSLALVAVGVLIAVDGCASSAAHYPCLLMQAACFLAPLLCILHSKAIHVMPCTQCGSRRCRWRYISLTFSMALDVVGMLMGLVAFASRTAHCAYLLMRAACVWRHRCASCIRWRYISCCALSMALDVVGMLIAVCAFAFRTARCAYLLM